MNVAKAREEIRNVLGDDRSPITREQLRQCTYVKQVSSAPDKGSYDRVHEASVPLENIQNRVKNTALFKQTFKYISVE